MNTRKRPLSHENLAPFTELSNKRRRVDLAFSELQRLSGTGDNPENLRMLYAEINKTYGVHIGDPLLEQIKQNISSLLKSLSSTPTVQRVIATYLTLGLTAKEAALITGLTPRQIYRMRNNLDSYDLSSLKFSVSNLIIFCNVVHLI
jgi:hypothetical protein